MEDTKKSNLLPVTAPREVWHLAHVAAFANAEARLRQALAAGLEADSLDGFTVRMAEELSQLSTENWNNYLRCIDKPLESSARTEVNVQFDESRDLPVVEWPSGPVSNAWGMVDIEGSGDELGIVLATPFREMAVERLPADTKLVKIHDPRHAATAALVEILQASRRDAESAFLMTDPRAAWRRLNRVIHIYRNAAQYGLESLSDDDFANWQPGVPVHQEIASAAAFIARIAQTSRAQMVVATHLMANWLQALADSTERLPAQERQAAFFALLGTATRGVEQSLDCMNVALAATTASEPDSHSFMVIMRPVPSSIPTLAIIPKADMSNVERLQTRAKPRAKAKST